MRKRGIPGEVPAYRVRVSARARRLQLKVSPLGTVEVVVPRNCRPDAITAFVQTHQAWLQRSLTRLALERARRPELSTLAPAQVELAACAETWQVDYVSAPRLRVRGDAASRCLHVAGPDEAAARRGLQGWLTRRARTVLVPWLAQLSEQTGLPFARVAIRAQKTRWGSCSSRGTLSLNRNLLFLPAPLVEYLFIHELCHTREMNHSPRFWQLVEGFEPEYRAREAALSQASSDVPLLASSYC